MTGHAGFKDLGTVHDRRDPRLRLPRQGVDPRMGAPRALGDQGLGV
jgi:hypothetical protein